jgi:hypothetical protein
MNYPSRRGRARTALAAAALTALVAPAGALAAPSVFTQTAKVVPAGQTPTASWTQADLGDQEQYLVSENGFTLALRESNGKLGHGLLGFDVLPSAYRALVPTSQWLAESATGVQPHATCDAPALTSDAVVLGWQGAEPHYGYIPFQATAAGLGDDPKTWVGKVKTATGVTLIASTDLAAACAGLGGTFAPADAVVTPATALAAGVTGPLQAKIGELTIARDAALAAKAKAEAEVKRLTLEATPFTIKVPSSATLQRGLEVNVAGPANRPVFVRIQITEAQRKTLKLRYRTLGVGTGKTDEKGKAQVVVQPRKDTAKILLRLVDALPTTVAAVSGDRSATLALDLGA